MNGKAAIFSEDGGLISHRRCRLNMRLAQWGVTSKIESSCFYLTLVQFDSLVLLSPPLRQAPKR